LLSVIVLVSFLLIRFGFFVDFVFLVGFLSQCRLVLSIF
jgi:hypothetical protein